MEDLRKFASVIDVRSSFQNPDRTVICINNNVYDVTDFLKQHPGGEKIIKDLSFTDATQDFNDIGHSDEAHKQLDKFKIGTITENFNSVMIAKKPKIITSYKKGISKLFTHEDFMNIHKILGFLVLISYIYRTLVFVYYRYVLGNHNYEIFNNDIFTLGTILLHATLSMSSLMFNVPRNRINDKPMIWQEFRAHNILFAGRSIISMLISYFMMGYLALICKVATVLLTLVIADIITDKLRDKEIETTTRTMPYWPECSKEREWIHKKYYRFAQFAATLSCVGGMSSAFFVMFPIQFASLLMTLVRKGFLTCKDWHVYYLASLLYPLVLYLNHAQMYIVIIPVCVCMTIIRSNMRISKYVLWIPILLGYLFML